MDGREDVDVCCRVSGLSATDTCGSVVVVSVSSSLSLEGRLCRSASAESCGEDMAGAVVVAVALFICNRVEVERGVDIQI